METQIYTNKLGQSYKIISFHHRTEKGNFWLVEFIETGYQKVVAMTDLKRGRVKDRLAKSVAGVGYYGADECEYNSTSRMYRVWHNMINRCYNPNSTEWRHYGACGVTVCDRWHCFTNFVKDVPNISGYDEELFEDNLIHLDKDEKQWKMDKKVYSPKTCQFVAPLENGRLIDRERRAILSINPQGLIEEWSSVYDFVNKHKTFNRNSIYKCLSGMCKTYKKWSFDYCNDYRKPICN